MPNQFFDNLDASLEEAMENLGSQNYQRFASYQREKLTLFFDQGRFCTARIALDRARRLESEAKTNDDRAHGVALLADNLLTGTEKTLEKQKEATKTVSKMADATQKAADIIANLSSEVASVLAICEATLYGSEICDKAREIDSKVKQAVSSGENASLNSLDATTNLSDSVIPAMVNATGKIQNQTKSIGDLTNKLFNRAKNDYMKSKEAMDKASASVSIAHEAYVSSDRYLRDADHSIASIGRIVNMGIALELQCGEDLIVSCNRFQSPFIATRKAENETYPLSGSECQYRLAIVGSKDVFTIDKEELLKLPKSKCNAATSEGAEQIEWKLSVGGSRYPEVVDIDGNALSYGTNYRAFVCVFLADSYELKAYSADLVSLPSKRFRPRKYLLKANPPELDFANRKIRFHLENQKRFKEIADRIEFRAMLIPVRRASKKGNSENANARKLIEIEGPALRELSKTVEKMDPKFLNSLIHEIKGELADRVRDAVTNIERRMVERMKQVEEFDSLTSLRKDAVDESDINDIECSIADVEQDSKETYEGIEGLRGDMEAAFQDARELVSKTDVDEQELIFDYKIATNISPQNYLAVMATSEQSDYEVEIDELTTDVYGNLLQDNGYYKAIVLSALIRDDEKSDANAYRKMLSKYSLPEKYEIA